MAASIQALQGLTAAQILMNLSVDSSRSTTPVASLQGVEEQADAIGQRTILESNEQRIRDSDGQRTILESNEQRIRDSDDQGPRKKGKHWSKEELLEIAELKQKRKTIAEIAAKFKTSENAIDCILKRQKSGGSLKKKYVPWTKHQIDILCKFANNRASKSTSVNDFALEVGHSAGSCLRKIKELTRRRVIKKK